jgi:4-amino-4-deoxy-L-arabinose transferase-like glycosyltransferase
MQQAPEIQPVGNTVVGSSRWNDWKLLGLLLAVAAAIHVWLIAHTEVTARDGVGFIRYAWQLQSQPWLQVLRDNPHPPLYPLTILAVSYPVRSLVTGTDQAVMQLCAQLASSLAGILLVVPMFFLGRQLFDRRVGFWAAMLFQCFPACSRVLADALSEALFLFLTAAALVLAIQAIRSNRPRRFAWSGLFGGLAYLTRPEGVLVILAPMILFSAAQIIPGWRRPWRQTLTAAISLLLPALALGIPYVAVIGQFTNKTTGQGILHASLPEKQPDSSVGARVPVATASVLAIYGRESKGFDFLNHHLWCLTAVGTEIVKGYHYIAWFPALLAWIYFRRQFGEHPEAWVCWVLVALHVLLLWRVAYVAGYVAERHSLLIVMSTLPWAVAGITIIAGHLGALGRWLARPWIPAAGPIWALFILLALAASGLPKTLEPMHTNRAGFHAAGLWLSDHVQPGDRIIDPFSWTEYYAGQVWRQLQKPDPVAPSRFTYVVLGGTRTEHERLPLMPDAKNLAQYGTLVFQWHSTRARAEEVLVYQVPSPLPIR